MWHDINIDKASYFLKHENSLLSPKFLLGCNFTTVNHYKLKEHCRSHTREKIFACMTCGGMFANKAKFVDHVVRQNSSGCKWFLIQFFH